MSRSMCLNTMQLLRLAGVARCDRVLGSGREVWQPALQQPGEEVLVAADKCCWRHELATPFCRAVCMRDKRAAVVTWCHAREGGIP
ncbi:hypothetical protein GE09DRAFT_1094214 [Coniochaeta sp. 2T2.1]|nr:hypothetical protein GE09DRAFT_1094214 [Coniochaeta sp. 2T2.1]